MFQLNLDKIMESQIGQPTYLPMLLRAKADVQQRLQAQIVQADNLIGQVPSEQVAQTVGQWLAANDQLLNESFEQDPFISHYLNRPVWGPLNLGVEQAAPDHRNLVAQMSERLKALFVLTIFLPDRDIATTPESHVHPSLRLPVWRDFVDGHFEQAVTEAWLEVERAVRQKALPHDQTLQGQVGQQLMTSAFRPRQNPPANPQPGAAVPAPPGVLTDVALPFAEQQGIMQTFSGVMSAFRNPPAHRHVAFTRRDAFCEILFASRLLFYVDSRP